MFAIIYQANVDQQKSESKTYIVLPATDLNARCDVHKKSFNKTVVESVQLGNTYIADMDKCTKEKCCLDICRGDSCNLLYVFPGPFV